MLPESTGLVVFIRNKKRKYIKTNSLIGKNKKIKCQRKKIIKQLFRHPTQFTSPYIYLTNLKWLIRCHPCHLGSVYQY